MDVRELLTQHRIVNTAIDCKLEQIADLRRVATHITHEISSAMVSGGRSDKVGGSAARIADLEAEINRDIDRLVDIKDRIRSVCEMLPDETQRTIIERRYILHEDWEDIADKMGYSSRHVCRLHTKAVEYLDSMLRNADRIAS